MPNRTLLIAGNWKMNNDVAEGRQARRRTGSRLFPRFRLASRSSSALRPSTSPRFMTAFRLPLSPSVHRM